MPGNVLVLPTISTTFNYDYMNGYFLYPNGVLQARVSTVVMFRPLFGHPTRAYGTDIHKDLAGTIHDHMLHYKVDLDADGRKNYFENVDFYIENITYH